MLIDGQWIDTEKKIGVINPYDNSVIDYVPRAEQSHVDMAIDSASQYDFSLSSWDRYEILHRFSELLQEKKDEFSDLISLESGKPLKESHIEVERAYQTFLMSGEEAKRIDGEVLNCDAVKGMSNRLALVLREPVGVILAITPFNYPLNLVAHKVGPAIASNNSIILKPSSLTPLTALKMAELLIESGIPKRMLHVLTGHSSEIGDYLVTNPLIRKITFTGSVPVGKSICQKVGMKQISMELGGNDPLIVLNDANLDKAVDCATVGAFGNNGQRCTSIKRIIIENSVAEPFLEAFIERAKGLKVGNQMNLTTDIGPLITEKAAKEIEDKVESALNNGAVCLLGGKREGALFWPTILDHVSSSNPIVMEEIFGPIAPIIRVEDFEQAIRVANATNYGLQAGIFTNHLDKAMEAAKRLQVGGVIINNGPGFRAEHLPFGGSKDSGLGREGVKYAINEMTQLKTVVL